MMSRRTPIFWLFVLSLFLLASCQQGASSEAASTSSSTDSADGSVLEPAAARRLDSIPPASLVSEWIPPVQLTGVKTVVQLDNSFSDVSRIDSVVASPGIRAQLSPDKREVALTIEGDPGFLSTFRIWAGGESYDLLLKYPVKKRATLRLRDEGYKSVMVKGEMNNWDQKSAVMKLQNGIWEYTFDLAPGDYLYRFVVDGKEMVDPKNPLTGKSNSGGTYSLLSLKQARSAAKMPVIQFLREVEGAVEVQMSNPGAVFAFWENHLIPTRKEGGRISIPIPEEAAFRGQTSIRIFGQNESGISNEMVIPLDKGKVANETAGGN